jgi:hypothetical protein
MDFSNAPKTKALGTAKAKIFRKVIDDKTRIKELEKNAEESIFFDHGAKRTRDRRERTRNEFEYFVTENYEVTGVAQIWNIDHFTVRTKLFLSVMVEVVTEQMKGN